MRDVVTLTSHMTSRFAEVLWQLSWQLSLSTPPNVIVMRRNHALFTTAQLFERRQSMTSESWSVLICCCDSRASLFDGRRRRRAEGWRDAAGDGSRGEGLSPSALYVGRRWDGCRCDRESLIDPTIVLPRTIVAATYTTGPEWAWQLLANWKFRSVIKADILACIERLRRLKLESYDADITISSGATKLYWPLWCKQ